MIAALRGNILKKRPISVLLEVNNVIYEVVVSLNTYSELEGEVFVYISEIIREDSWTLYGFSSELEKQMFDTLIKINGVGPKVALAICSTFSPATFSGIIQTKNVSALKQVPGIGPKSANRILVELSEFNISEENVELEILDAITALEGLGFKKENIQKALKEIDSSSTEEIIKQALKKLANF